MKTEIYLKECPEDKIYDYYDIVNVYLKEEHKDLFTSKHIQNWIEDGYIVFFVPEASNDVTPKMCYNALQYGDVLSLDYMLEYTYKSTHLIVCKEKEYQRASKISEKKISPEEYAYKAYCPDCMNFCCTCDSPIEESTTDGMISNYSKLGGKILHDKFVHGDYMDYWDVIPVNKVSINNLVESPNSYIYIQLRNNLDYWFRITDYYKEELMNMIPAINTIIEIDNKYDREPPTVSTILEKNETRQDLQIKISLTILTVGMASFVTGFVMDYNALMIFGALCIPILLFFSVWYSTQSNKFRKL
jgi:hypothetical protein